MISCILGVAFVILTAGYVYYRMERMCGVDNDKWK